jgi:hypothetical protein
VLLEAGFPGFVHPKHIERSIPMSKSTFIDFRAVKAEVTMVQVLEHYGLMSQMKQNGDSITGIQAKYPDFQRRDTSARIKINKRAVDD